MAVVRFHVILGIGYRVVHLLRARDIVGMNALFYLSLCGVGWGKERECVCVRAHARE